MPSDLETVDADRRTSLRVGMARHHGVCYDIEVLSGPGVDPPYCSREGVGSKHCVLVRGSQVVEHVEAWKVYRESDLGLGTKGNVRAEYNGILTVKIDKTLRLQTLEDGKLARKSVGLLQTRLHYLQHNRYLTYRS